MEIAVREYRESDHDACKALWLELARHHAKIYGDPSIAEGDPGEWLDEYLGQDDRSATWVAELNGRVVGMAGLLVSRENLFSGEIEPVIVTGELRSRGIGTTLVQWVTDEAKKRGMRFMVIRPPARNVGAFNLYHKLGFDVLRRIDLIKDLGDTPGRDWKSSIEIHGRALKY